MKIRIKEKRIFTLKVRSEPGAGQKQVKEEAIRQLNAHPLESTSLIRPRSFDLWKDGTVKEGNKQRRVKYGTNRRSRIARFCRLLGYDP
jgi:hypothetical protein